MIAPAFSFIGWLFERIELIALQKIFYLLSIFVLFLGMLELFRNRKIRKNELFQSKAEKTAQLALSPEKQAEEVLRTMSTYRKVVKIMLEKIKGFFKWIYNNKQALTSILSSLVFVALSQYALYSDLLLQWDFFVENTLAMQITGGILTGLFLINQIYTIINKYGVENLSQIDERLKAKKEEKASRLTKEQKLQVKEQYETVENEWKKAKAECSKFEKIINDYRVLSSIDGLSISIEKTNEYNYALANYDSSKNTVLALEKQKEKIHEALKK